MADTPTKMPEIVIDHREMRSPVAKILERLGVKLTFRTLLVGDYVVSDRIAFERKTMVTYSLHGLMRKSFSSNCMILHKHTTDQC
jgi:hypothetical protein